MNLKESVNEYIFSWLFPIIKKENCPTKINLRTTLKEFLIIKGVDSLECEDLATRWMPELIRKFKYQLDGWNKLGVPYPCCQSDEKEELFLTWKHKKYEELTGLPPISDEFVSILDWVESLDSKQFLVACAAYVKMLGATKIYITDGPGDGGVDLIARVEKSPFNSVIFFVQAKTASLVTRDTVLMEYGKYLSLPHEDIYQKYRRSLELDLSADGASFCYMIVANCEFQNSAKDISSKLGILLRSKTQISYFLSKYYDRNSLESMQINLKNYLRADLEINIVDKMI